MQAALAEGREQASGPIRLEGDAADQIRLLVSPVLDAAGKATFLLVIFERLDRQPTDESPVNQEALEENALISRYESELERANDQLQRAVENYETLNEELKASNEELLSMLEKAGHRVDVAENGRRALTLLAERNYDCILMDIQMPVMDGVEATRAIRTRPDLQEKAGTPIIAM